MKTNPNVANYKGGKNKLESYLEQHKIQDNGKNKNIVCNYIAPFPNNK